MPTREEKADLAAVEKEINDLISDVAVDITINASRNVYQATPVDTGWTRENWNPSIDTEDTTVRGYIPARVNRQRKSKEIIDKFEFPKNKRLYVANPLKHVVELNAGKSKKAPAGFVQKAVRDAVRETEAKLRQRARRGRRMGRPSSTAAGGEQAPVTAPGTEGRGGSGS